MFFTLEVLRVSESYVFTQLQFVRSERADHDVISVGITKRELPGSSVWVQIGLLFEFIDKSAGPRQRFIKIIHAEEQE